MAIRIFREGGNFKLIPERLAHQLSVTGVIAFTSGRVRHRQVANQVMERVAPSLNTLHAETVSGVMCIVDTTRYSIFETLKQVAHIDDEFERGLNEE